MKKADFKIRLVASLIDSFICLLLFALLYWDIVNQPDLPGAFADTILALTILFNPVLILYSVLMTYYFGGTLGKLVTGLQIVAEDHKKLSFQRIFFRQTIGYSFSWIFFGLGYYAIVKDPNKQAWHDKAAGSRVVQEDNLLFQGILLSLLLLIASTYIFIQATQIFAQSPLHKEIQLLNSSLSTPSPAPDKISN